jgi:hypothetical protein
MEFKLKVTTGNEAEYKKALADIKLACETLKENGLSKLED